MRFVRRDVLAVAGWTGILMVGEWLVYPAHIWQCLRQAPPSHSPVAYHKMAILADPQLSDAYSYAQSAGWGLALVQFYSDLYMRRAFRALQWLYRPDSVLFLGDLLDGGREWAEEPVYRQEWARFQSVFPPPELSLGNLHGMAQQFLYMPGNHDIGFGDKIVPTAVLYYRKYVHDKLNFAVTLGGFELVILDSVSLSSSSPISTRQESLAFLESYETTKKRNRGDGKPPSRRILFTHVPLYRPATANCSRHLSQRQNSNLVQGRGYQYQNLVTEELSRRILDAIQPEVVFSGDDHDQCLYHHDHIPEVFHISLRRSHIHPLWFQYTLGTFSWLQGNWYPSFAQLYLDQDSFRIHVCFLPAQILIYAAYACLFVLTTVVFFSSPYFPCIGALWNSRRASWIAVERDPESAMERGSAEKEPWQRAPETCNAFQLRRLLTSYIYALLSVLLVYLLLLWIW